MSRAGPGEPGFAGGAVVDLGPAVGPVDAVDEDVASLGCEVGSVAGVGPRVVDEPVVPLNVEDGAVRFGLSALKGVGTRAAELLG